MRDDPNSSSSAPRSRKGTQVAPHRAWGMVVGVVRSKLDAIKMSKATSDSPERQLRDQEFGTAQVSRGHAGYSLHTETEPAAQIDPVQLYDELRPAIVPVVATSNVGWSRTRLRG